MPRGVSLVDLAPAQYQMRAYNYSCVALVAHRIYNLGRLLHPMLDIRAATLQAWLYERVLARNFFSSDVPIY